MSDHFDFTACSDCAHQKVCSKRGVYLDAIKALREVSVNDGNGLVLVESMDLLTFHITCNYFMPPQRHHRGMVNPYPNPGDPDYEPPGGWQPTGPGGTDE